MDWFRQNPFFGALAAIATVLIVGGGWLVFSEMTRAQELRDEFDQKSSQLRQLEGSKPFPDQANVNAAEDEQRRASAILDELSKSLSVPLPEAATPQAFQDELAKSMQDLAEKAKVNGVTLSDKLFLGFEKYQNQIPRSEAVPGLLLQLRSIVAVASTLIDSKVVSVDSVTREALDDETPAELDGDKGTEASDSQPTALSFPSFAISFVSYQPAFRLAFNRVMEIAPPILVRNVSIKNSSPAAPAKASAPVEGAVVADPAAPSAPDAEQIKPVLGTETLAVTLTLASAIPSAQPTPSSKK